MTSPVSFYTDEHPSETMMRAARALVDGKGVLNQQTAAVLAELLAKSSSLTRNYRPEDFHTVQDYTKVSKAILGEQ